MAERAFPPSFSPLLLRSGASFRTVPQLTEHLEEAKRAHSCNLVYYLAALSSILPLLLLLAVN